MWFKKCALFWIQNCSLRTLNRSWRGRDIAILVDNRYLGRQLEIALRKAGIPAVSGGTEAVTSSAAAGELRALLQALVRPATQGPARRVALGWFGSQQLADLAAQDDAALVRTQESLAAWGAVLQQRLHAKEQQAALGNGVDKGSIIMLLALVGATVDNFRLRRRLREMEAKPEGKRTWLCD